MAARTVRPVKKTSSKKASVSEDAGRANRERPDEPKPYKARKEELLKFYRDMLLIRRFEEKAGQLYGMGLIGGFCHLYIGQEAVVTGMQHASSEGDCVITTYRDHGHMLACGMDPKGIMAELTGRATGFSKGKGGSMHMFSVEKHFYGGHGIVGASVPLGAGIAFAHKYRGNNNICLCYYGDGAANQGQVYEAYNMAALWQLPIIFIIENNEYAMGTSVKRHHGSHELYKAGEALGVLPEALVEVPHLEEEEVVRVAVAELHVLLQKRGKWTWAFALEHAFHLNSAIPPH